ncbi:hypothetical protein HK102_008866 [Quaeritorhiza haematococci]|nr:hypothetical protein HK102_008866 [Quaeritorhiza haematococci]
MIDARTKVVFFRRRQGETMTSESPSRTPPVLTASSSPSSISLTPNVMLTIANDDQVLQARRNNYAEWGVSANLTIDRYLEREQHLANRDFAKDGLITWILVPAKDATGFEPGTILSACETYRRPALVTLGDGQVHKVRCFSVASVFTPAKYRGHGYAGTMMKLLLELLRTQLRVDEGVWASNLYSDIGPVYYNRLGWKVYPAIAASISVKGEQAPYWTSRTGGGLAPPPDNPAHEDVVPVTVEQLLPIASYDTGEIHKMLETRTKPTLVLQPTSEAIDWLFSRGQFYCRQMKLGRDVTACGARLAANTTPSSASTSAHSPLGISPSGFGQFDFTAKELFGSFILWMHDFPENKLVILRFRAADSVAVKALLGAAVREAKEWNLDKVILWDPDMEGVLAPHKDHFVVEERKSSLPSLAYFGDRQHQNEGAFELDWCLKEKYGWV